MILEPMNGDFRKLLDEQKKSNELLSSIDVGQQEQGTAKEIIKQALHQRLQMKDNFINKE